MNITPTTKWSDFDIAPYYGAPRPVPENFPLYCAAYLPFKNEQIDWPSFRKVIQRIVNAGGIPVINADTGFSFLLTEEQKVEVVKFARREFPNQLLCVGVTVTGDEGKTFHAGAYQRVINDVEIDDKIEIMVMISPGLVALEGDELIAAYESLKMHHGIVHELTSQFVPFGRQFTPYELHGILSLPQYKAVKTSELFGKAIAPRMAMKELTGVDASILSGVDYKISEAYCIADGILMGAMVLFPRVYRALLELRRAGVSDLSKMDQFEEVMIHVQAITNLQFMPNVAHGTFDVGNYRHLTAILLKLLGVIDSEEQPPGTLRHHKERKGDLHAVRGMIRTLREALTAVGLSPDLVL